MPPRAGGILYLDIRGRVADLRGQFVPTESVRPCYKPLNSFGLGLLDEFLAFLTHHNHH